MRKLLLMLLIAICAFSVQAQTSKTLAVMVHVETSESPLEITLKWKDDNGAVNYEIYRKSKSAKTWGTKLTSLAAGSTSYTDKTVVEGKEYEYFVKKLSSKYQGSGYVLAGINVPMIENKGTLLLLVDNDLASSIGTSLDTLVMDLAGSGYYVVINKVPSSEDHVAVKARIKAAKAKNDDLNTIFILGHVAVPYSGQFCNDAVYTVPPDGHGPGQGDHCGAWAADAFYAIDYDGWKDEKSVTSTARREANKNRKGDGKYDEIRLPADAVYELGRVDLSSLTSFTETETELIKRYIGKSHRYKMAIDIPYKKALISENFPTSMGFASTAWRNFPAMVGAENVAEKNFLTVLKDSTYLWAYGTGGGSYSSCNKVAKTTDFKTNNTAMFNMLFGSFFGDWDVDNNILRAVLATKKGGLANAWSGRPFWQMHPLAFNETIGYSTKITQNNDNTYSYNVFRNSMHIALMGDPTLKLNMYAPVTGLAGVASSDKLQAELSWTASTAADIIGYHIYFSHQINGPYYKANKTLVTGTTFIDDAPYDGTVYYMVRALRKENTLSGSFMNLSQGVFVKVDNLDPVGIEYLQKVTKFSLLPNPSNGLIQVKYELMTGNSVNVTVFDLSGRSVWSAIWEGKGMQEHKLELNHLNGGVYFIQVGNNKQKVIIN